MNQPEDLSIAVFVINLDRARDRWARISARLDSLGLEYRRVSAVDGKTIVFSKDNYDERAYRRLHGKLTNPNEVGCYLSHIKALSTFIATQKKYAIILEDDALLHDDCMELVRSALNFADTWDMLRLHGVHGGGPIPYARLSPGSRLCVDITRQTGSSAYMVNRRAALRMLDKLEPMKLPYDHAFERDWAIGIRCSAVHPFCSSIEQGESTIGYGKPLKLRGLCRYLTVFPFRAWSEMSRVVTRSARAAKLLIGGIFRH